MIVKCLNNKAKFLPSDCKSTSSDPNWDFYLKLNEYYIVYAMTLRSNYVWYYICDEMCSGYPEWKPSPLFEVVDGSLSKYWIYSFIWEKDLNYTKFTWAYPEWANEPDNYFDRLTDGDPDEVEIFDKYKKLMDLEFPNPSIQNYAKKIDDNWLFCEYCIDAWESTAIDQGMVICPTCQRMMHNPMYQIKRFF